jgi:hypothetical protein
MLAWRDMLSHCPTPEDDNVNTCISEVAEQMARLKETVTAVEKTFKYVADSKGNIDPLYMFFCKADQWKETEKELCEASRRAIMPCRYADVISARMFSLVMCADEWRRQAKSLQGCVINDRLQFLVIQNKLLAGGLLEMLDLRAKNISELSRVENELSNLRGELDQARLKAGAPKNFFEKLANKPPEKLEASIAKRETRVDYLRNAIMQVSKSLLYCEIDRFSHERMMKMVELVRDIVAMNVNSAKENMDAWQTVQANL